MPSTQRNKSLMVGFQTQPWVGGVFGEEQPSNFSLSATAASAGICSFLHQGSCVCRVETGMCVSQASVFTVGGSSEAH